MRSGPYFKGKTVSVLSTECRGPEENVWKKGNGNDKAEGENCIMLSFIICILHQTLLKRSNQEGWASLSGRLC
jgi:hypothetical protein